MPPCREQRVLFSWQWLTLFCGCLISLPVGGAYVRHEEAASAGSRFEIDHGGAVLPFFPDSKTHASEVFAWKKKDHSLNHGSEDFRKCLKKLCHAITAGSQLATCQSKGMRLEPAQLNRWHSWTPEDMAKFLAGRRVVFVGDSVGAMTMQYLTCALQQTEGAAPAVTVDAVHRQFHNLVHFPLSDITLEVLEGGWNSEHEFNLIQEFPRLLARLKPVDIVQVNTGVHWTDPAKLQEEVGGLASAVAKSVTEQGSQQTGPLVFWRECTPQHFDSKNGFPGGGSCKPISADMKGKANIRNDIARPILESSGVSVIKVFDALFPLYDSHCGSKPADKDCTHWSLDANAFLLEALLNAAEAKGGK